MVNLKRLLYSVTLITLLVLLCISPQFISFVSANFFPASVPEHSIEITKSGAVNGTDMIQRIGNVYTFTGDIAGSMVVFCSDIVIDGAGHTLQGNGSLNGIWMQGQNSVEIKNLHIKNFRYGIHFTYAESLAGCTNITLSQNSLTDNTYGIKSMIFSKNNYLEENIIANNTYGVFIHHCPSYVFRNNQLSNNTYNLWVDCETSSHMSSYISDIDDSNTINGKPITYWVNEKNKTVPVNTGYVALVNCTNITVENFVLTNNSQGILLVATNNSVITRNHLRNNHDGIAFQGSYECCFNNVITKNNITQNTNDGIYAWGAWNTSITKNIVTNNQEVDISLYDCPNAYIVENAITKNKVLPIRVKGGSSNSTVNNNDAELEQKISNEIPEFPSWTVLPILLTGLLLVAVYRKKLKHQKTDFKMFTLLCGILVF
ncbi:MAG: right-handed parallel beta-helix repeat-containing protein [Candidatus Bathyarchaeota archaeon]|nr:right-handed parallel beta-helix repeat-containing protein [Candidatus Bathyarchaeum sp.]